MFTFTTIASYFTIEVLNFIKVPALFSTSFSVFHSRLPINQRESIPYLFVCAQISNHPVRLLKILLGTGNKNKHFQPFDAISDLFN